MAVYYYINEDAADIRAAQRQGRSDYADDRVQDHDPAVLSRETEDPLPVPNKLAEGSVVPLIKQRLQGVALYIFIYTKCPSINN